MNGDPIIKRKRPGPQPAAPTQQEIFREAYMRALGGLCCQFEATPYVNRRPSYCDGKAEIERAQQITRRAWNVAVYSCQLFETDSFNREVDLF